jgi:hypothetical protein
MEMRLIENAPQCAYGDFVLPRHDCRVDEVVPPSDELYVTTLLARLNESSSFQPTLDVAEGLRLSRPNLDLD